MDKVDQNILVAVDHSNQAENAVKCKNQFLN